MKINSSESPEEVLNIIDEADDEATKEEAEANENATVSTDNSNQDNNEPYV